MKALNLASCSESACYRMMTRVLFALVFTVFASSGLLAQNEFDTAKTYLVTKNDGTEYVGKILKSDEREILLNTSTVGRLIIPKHEIKSIKEVDPSQVAKGEYLGEEPFATRHILTSNGLPLGKGNNYAQINWWGPEVEFGVGKKLSVGVMTSWFAIPLVGNVKYSIEVAPKFHIGVGALVGTLSWAKPDGFGALPFASATFGTRKSNITLTGGYLTVGAEGESASQALFSIAAMARLSKKVSFIFDSFIVPASSSDLFGTTSILVPALRFHGSPTKSFQFGFGATAVDGEFFPLPIPVLSWFRAF